jgi:Papain-like cysteine protease AvrRpt2
MKPTGFFAWLLGMGSEPKSTFEAKGNYGEMSGKPGEVNPHLNYKVPFVHQQHINLCGDACALMLQKFWGMATNISVDQNPRGPLTGSNTDDIVAFFPPNACKSVTPKPANRTWDSRRLAYALACGGPIICSTENLGGLVGHFLVLKGIDDDQLFFHDPWRGPDLPQPLSWLNDHLEWEDSDCMLYVDPPR